MLKENKLEKSSKNQHNQNVNLVLGGIVESIVPEVGTFVLIGASTINTYAWKNFNNAPQEFQTPSNEMPLYAVKNSAKILMGATAVSILRYLF